MPKVSRGTRVRVKHREGLSDDEDSDSDRECRATVVRIDVGTDEDTENATEITSLTEDPIPDTTEMDPFFALKTFQSLLLATVLEDAIKPFQILEECNNATRVQRAVIDYQPHLRNKYGVEWKTPDELENINEKKLHCNEYKVFKLDRDRQDIKAVLDATYVKLCVSSSYRPMWEKVKEYESTEKYRKLVNDEAAKNKALAREAYKQLRQQRNQNKRAIYDLDFNIDDLSRKIEDAELSFRTKGRYIDNWQKARTEQHEASIRLKEEFHASKVDHFKINTEYETRVHMEVEILYSILIEETLNSVEDAMTKYEQDIEEIDLKIQIKTGDYQNMNDRRKEMEKKLVDNGKAITAWVKFKQDRAEAELYKNTMMASAIIVQAWWRGLLVRKQLGPYRPQKKAKGGGKKKKKGGDE